MCCGLHSQLAPVVAGIGTGVRIAYVQLAGGALPVALSDTVRLLKTRQLLETAVAVAPCFDGDVQALSTASALAWAKAKGFDVVVCGIGPGIVGSGSALGHGGLAVSDAANAAAALGGRAIVVVRYSGRDPRERHGGVSHHTRSALRLILGDRDVVWPSGLARDAAIGRRGRGRGRGLARDLLEPVPHAHGPPRGRRPVVLRRRIRGGSACARGARLRHAVLR